MQGCRFPRRAAACCRRTLPTLLPLACSLTPHSLSHLFPTRPQAAAPWCHC